MPVLLYTVGGGSVSSWGVVGVQTDGVISAGLLPLHIHQLSFCLHRHEGEGVGAHLIVNNLLRLRADCFGNLIAFLLLLDHQAILHIFPLTVSLEGWHTDLSLLLNIVHSALFPVILNTRAMGSWLGMSLWVGMRLRVGMGLWVGMRLWVMVRWSWLVMVYIWFG